MAASEYEKKIDILRKLMRSGEWSRALKLASTFARLGDERVAILKGWEACARPGFQRQIGRDPDAAITAGIAALKSRYG